MTTHEGEAQLTAYVVDELDDAARAEVAARLQADPIARAEADEIRQVADILTAELSAEPAPRLTERRRRAVEAQALRAGGHGLNLRLWAPLAAVAAVAIAAGLWAVAARQERTRQLADKPSVRLAPIAIELPMRLFTGTPKPVDEPNIAKPSGRPRPPFLAPVGTRNLALGRPVTSSDNMPIMGELEQITDGDKEGTDGSFVELGPGLQWVQIDLGTRSTIYAVLVWHYHADPRAYRDVVVQVAEDVDFINPDTVFNADHDNSSGLGARKHKGYVETYEGKLIDCKGVEGRYVKLYSNGNSTNVANHYIEVEVYGIPD